MHHLCPSYQESPENKNLQTSQTHNVLPAQQHRIHNEFRITLWLTAPLQKTKPLCQSSHVTPPELIHELSFSSFLLTVCSFALVTWLRPNWLVMWQHEMGQSPLWNYASYISITWDTVKGQNPWLKWTSCPTPSLNFLPPVFVCLTACVVQIMFLTTAGLGPIRSAHINFDEHHRHSHAQWRAICASVLRWTLAGSLSWEVENKANL